MNTLQYTERITCAYLYSITRYGYPPDIRKTADHIREMAQMGFTAIELEGIGAENIRYLHTHRDMIAEQLAASNCKVPVLCIVLPQLGSVDNIKRAESLELFETGCAVARSFGAEGVLDNGPLLPLEYPRNAPVRRHYTDEHLSGLQLPVNFNWEEHWHHLTDTYRKACEIAAGYGLDYHLHPCEGSLITGTDAFVNFSQAVGCNNLLFNLDTANQFYFRDNLPLSVFRLADKMSYIHISDNTGGKVEHLVPGDGAIDWDSFFSTLRDVQFKGKFAIDVGGAETGIPDITAAYRRAVEWLSRKLERYSLN